MTRLDDMQSLLLEVVRESDGRWDTRNIDHVFHARSGAVEGSLLATLRDLERRSLIAEVHIEGGTGPGWRITDVGEQELR